MEIVREETSPRAGKSDGEHANQPSQKRMNAARFTMLLIVKHTVAKVAWAIS